MGVFQCRLRPSKYDKHGGDVWLVDNETDIRPCGILFRKLVLPDSQRIRYAKENPYNRLTSPKDWGFYQCKLRHCQTVKQARDLNRSLGNLHKDLRKGRLKLVGPGAIALKRKLPHDGARRAAGSM